VQRVGAMGASACSRCVSAAGENPHLHGPNMADWDGSGQARADMKVKFGGFAVGDFINENRARLEDQYKVQRETFLGEGSYSSVFRCTHKQTGHEKAVKAVSRRLLRSVMQVEEEIRIMRLTDHPNIVRLHETFEDNKCVYLVLELCNGGELFDALVDYAPLMERAAAACMQQMVRAVSYLHQNHIVHRDLKAENWLLANDGPVEKQQLKLADFGLAKRLHPGDFAKTKAGSPYYVAPEVLKGKYNDRADVWSLGVIMHMLLSGAPPFTGDGTKEVLEQVKVGVC